ncbi:hypothetical protein SK066_08550 [Paenibacillus hunanensis]|uniref:hypothetical protein n=1 Tax=Paenibacillus hunanensis TaxID=539262 RepID=UPI002A6B1766|nr:hypothetical protein [Paenibacillus hunanensis]WPP42970.1 hypothetical protein SK066_08550 [Paenibacillus hunanensis]
MPFEDEKIAAVLNEWEEQQRNHNILNGPVEAEGREYTFALRSFFDNRLHMYVPESFQLMSKSMQKAKYPYEDRPAVILTNGRCEVDLTFQHVDQPLQDDWIPELVDGMKQMVRNIQPTNVFYEQKIEQVNGKRIGYFDFKSPALDQPAYRLMFYLELDGETIIGGFSCPYKSYAEWRPLILQMLQTIYTTTPEGGASQ